MAETKKVRVAGEYANGNLLLVEDGGDYYIFYAPAKTQLTYKMNKATAEKAVAAILAARDVKGERIEDILGRGNLPDRVAEDIYYAIGDAGGRAM